MALALYLVSKFQIKRYVRDHRRGHSATTGSALRSGATSHWRPMERPHHANIAAHASMVVRVSAHNVQNCVDDIWLHSPAYCHDIVSVAFRFRHDCASSSYHTIISKIYSAPIT